MQRSRSPFPPRPRSAAFAAALSLVTLSFAISTLAAAAPASTPGQSKFAFAPDTAPAGFTAVAPATLYSDARGYGFEPGAAPGGPAYFSVDLAEGNYDVTVTLGDDKAAASTTVKAELRRLMLENVQTAPGQTVTRRFTVNVRTPRIAAANGIEAGEVRLKAPRETVQEAWAWDRRLTLEFNGSHPAVRNIEIAPAAVPTLFLLGDSTVCDQPGEPYASWGQMLPRFFKPGVAVANHGESGETYRDALARRRTDKILSSLRPGDTVVMQFGHNDQKQIKDGKGGPFTTYKAEIKAHVAAVRARGGVPVIVSPMERRGFDAQGKVLPSLADYAEAARQSARELDVAFIDLNAMSRTLYEALGPEGSKRAFAEPAPGKLDNTHHNAYGSYELAKAIVTGLQAARLPVAAFVVDGFRFDPSRPDPVAAFSVPPSPQVTHERPLGDEANK
ncbi:rhamnogalacturonan acetylesterase [Massilia forsythiae]|uniref:Rhamnogalacturonan acetylesterase n=1 Tax=Massilia forsythiae TaxID=2728020 RepID=A0A7Z2ZU63_9BURK|nr:rhamnogalacturonan acetylesterase [Massilia forsythiae]QJE01975.1 rhamnogalacturonan acetylesterase [Massilia forsythiae]